MEYVDLDARIGELSGVLDPTRYLDRLPSIAAELPPGARAFATDNDHYDFHGKRCVKDLELETVRGLGSDGDEIEMRLRHNCWKHDEDLIVHYSGVAGFHFGSTGADHWSKSGPVILDEILPHEDGCSHEFAFRNGTLTVVCRDLAATWTGAACPCP